MHLHMHSPEPTFPSSVYGLLTQNAVLFEAKGFPYDIKNYETNSFRTVHDSHLIASVSNREKEICR